MDIFIRKILRINPSIQFYVCNAHNNIIPIAMLRFRTYSKILKERLFSSNPIDFKYFFEAYRGKYVSRHIDIKRQNRMLETKVYYKNPLFKEHIRPEEIRLIEKYIQSDSINSRQLLFNRKLKAYCKTHTHTTLVNISLYLNRISRQKCMMIPAHHTTLS